MSELLDREGPSISCVEGPFFYCAWPFSLFRPSLVVRGRFRIVIDVPYTAQPGYKIKLSTWPAPICGILVENPGQQGDNFR